MSLNVLGYQSHLLQRCHSVCDREGSSHLSPVLAHLRFFIAVQVQPMYEFYSQVTISYFLLHGSQKNKNHDLIRIEVTISPAFDTFCITQHAITTPFH